MSGPPGGLSYEAYCGLLWNGPRVRSFGAVSVMQGIVAAFDLPSHTVCDAMARTADEARFLRELFEAQKREHEIIEGARR